MWLFFQTVSPIREVAPFEPSFRVLMSTWSKVPSSAWSAEPWPPLFGKLAGTTMVRLLMSTLRLPAFRFTTYWLPVPPLVMMLWSVPEPITFRSSVPSGSRVPGLPPELGSL